MTKVEAKIKLQYLFNISVQTRVFYLLSFVRLTAGCGKCLTVSDLSPITIPMLTRAPTGWGRILGCVDFENSFK